MSCNNVQLMITRDPAVFASASRHRNCIFIFISFIVFCSFGCLSQCLSHVSCAVNFNFASCVHFIFGQVPHSNPRYADAFKPKYANSLFYGCHAAAIRWPTRKKSFIFPDGRKAETKWRNTLSRSLASGIRFNPFNELFMRDAIYSSHWLLAGLGGENQRNWMARSSSHTHTHSAQAFCRLNGKCLMRCLSLRGTLFVTEMAIC